MATELRKLGAVVEEKTTRLTEMLFSSVDTFTLMMGKLLGVSLVALTQFLIWAGAFLLITLYGAGALAAAGGGGTISPSAPGTKAFGSAAGITAAGSDVRLPNEFKRKTMSTPLRPSTAGSLAAACCRRKSIASRMLASRNSIRGMMIVFSLAEIRAVPVAAPH